MSVFCTENALAASVAQLQSFEPIAGRVLTSKLFRDNVELQKFNAGLASTKRLGIGKVHRTVKKYVPLLQKALRIVVPELTTGAEEAEALAFNNFNNRYTNKMQSLVKIFQSKFPELTQDGDITPETLFKLDEELNRIKYYIHGKGGSANDVLTIHNDSTSLKVGKMHVLQFPTVGGKRCVLFSRPDDKLDPTDPTKYKYAMSDRGNVNDFNTRVFVEAKLVDDQGETGWWYVTVAPTLAERASIAAEYAISDPDSFKKEDKEIIHGYMWREHLTKNAAPEPNARLHWIGTNESIKDIVAQYYFTEPGGLNVCDESLDVNSELFKFYANLILYSNNREGRPLSDGDVSIAINPQNTSAQSLTETLLQNAYDYWKSHGITSYQPFVSGSSYTNFLNLLNDAGINTIWNWNTQPYNNSTSPIKVDPENYLWVPSKDFANYSYYMQSGSISCFWKLLKNFFANLADGVWPRGAGFGLEGAIGFTFGIPVGVDLEADLYIWREFTTSDDEYVFKVRKRGLIQAGIDAGVGVGGFVGFKRMKRGWRPDDDGYGLGAELGAQVEAKVKIEAYEEFEFRTSRSLFNFSEVDPAEQAAQLEKQNIPELAIIMTLLGGELVAMNALSGLTALSGFNLDPWNYLTRFKLQLGGFVAGNAGASAGLRWGNTKTQDAWTTGVHDNVSTPFSPASIFGLLNVSAGISVQGELGYGIDYKLDFGDLGSAVTDQTTGFKVPKSGELQVYHEGSVFAQTAIPFVPPTFNLLNVDRGIGIKTIYKYEIPASKKTIDQATDVTRLYMTSYGPYTFSGNMDRYLGPASEVYVGLCPYITSDASSWTSIDDLEGIIQEIRIEKRVGLSFLTRKANKIKIKQERLSRLLKSNYRQWGVGFGAFVAIETVLKLSSLEDNPSYDETDPNETAPKYIGYVMTQENQDTWNEFKGFAGALKEQVDDAMNSTLSWPDLIFQITGGILAGTGEGLTPKTAEFLRKVLDFLYTTELKFHGELYAGFALGGKVGAAVAKIRADGSIFGYLTYDQTFILENLEKAITQDPAGGIVTAQLKAEMDEIATIFKDKEMVKLILGTTGNEALATRDPNAPQNQAQ